LEVGFEGASGGEAIAAGAGAGEEGEEGEEDDAEVEAQGPVADVEHIVLEAFSEGGLSAEAVDLCPSGESGLGVVSEHVSWDVGAETFDEFRAFRAWTDEGHLAEEDVEELGEFVEAGFAEESSDGGGSRVVVGGPDGAGVIFGVWDHGSEFEDADAAAANAGADLGVEDGAIAGEFDEEGDKEHGESEEDGCGDGDEEVDRAFEDAVPAAEGCMGEGDDGKAIELIDVVSEEVEGEHVGDDADVEFGVGELVEELFDGFVVVCRESEEDDIDGA
jgi:hypothetical protein